MTTEQQLRARWPQAFNDERKPLKLGIHHDLGLDGPSAVLRAWTCHPDYIHNVMIPGAMRIDLDGSPVELVTEAERTWARERLSIPRRTAEEVAAEARQIWAGDTTKVATTPLSTLNIGGIILRSRYQKADEFEVLRDIVLSLSVEARSHISEMVVDSKATWALTITLKSWYRPVAERLAYSVSETLWRLIGGHGGITVTCLEEHFTIEAEWRPECKAKGF
jgi:hypothetical protein